jgi:hypothetical protein
MKNLTKLIVIAVFVLFASVLCVNKLIFSDTGSMVSAQTTAQPTPPAANAPAANANVNTNAAVNANANAAGTADKTIPKQFTLAKDSLSEYGEVVFNHETHAFGQYSDDGKSVIGCVVCHHTDQPKSALKPPLATSESEVALTFDVWKKSGQKVKDCRSCHFQEGNIPDGKSMPVAGEKEITNELAYHINCNTCHDAAAKLRPDLKKKPGFATTNDCTICHKKN